MSHLAAAQTASHKRHVSPEHPCRARKSRCHTARFTAERTPAEALNSLQFAYPEINDEKGGTPLFASKCILGFDIFFFLVFEFGGLFFLRSRSSLVLYVSSSGKRNGVRGLMHENKYPMMRNWF